MAIIKAIISHGHKACAQQLDVDHRPDHCSGESKDWPSGLTKLATMIGFHGS